MYEDGWVVHRKGGNKQPSSLEDQAAPGFQREHGEKPVAFKKC